MIPPKNDISPDFRYDHRDAQITRMVLKVAETPEAIKLFERHAWKLTDYGYWFVLGALWVSYTGWSNLDTWKRLFSSKRPNRATSIMKPSEYEFFSAMPPEFLALRAHRPDEQDWISYTLSPERVVMFAQKRGVDRVTQYKLKRENVMAVFLRREEYEVIVLDRSTIEFYREIPIVSAEKIKGSPNE